MRLQHFSLFASCATTAALLAALTPAQQLVRSVNGPAAGSRFGRACIAISDQNADGYTDVLVGAPGFNQNRGAIHCISGAYLALGGANATLWSLTPPVAQYDSFGASLAEIPDATGDGVKDFLVGQPGYTSPVTGFVGAVRLIDGATHGLVAQLDGVVFAGSFGTAVTACGANQVVISSPGSYPGTSSLCVVNVSQLSTSGPVPSVQNYALAGTDGLGVSLTAGPDLNADGLPEIIAGAPGYASGAGAVAIYFPGTSIAAVIFTAGIPGEQLGASIAATHDYDGDGVIDIVAGAPHALDAIGQEAGRVMVLSGAKLAANTPPFEIRTLTLPFSSQFFDFHFGAAVSACHDLNNDGVGEILVGAPDYTTVGAGGSINNWGLVSIFSGATGARWGGPVGANIDLLGDSIAGAIQDLDGDGFEEFVVAGSRSDAGGTDSGVVKCYRLFPIAPRTYCTGKVNSLGCTPSIGFSGTPTASAVAGPFTITANNIVNQKSGLLFHSHSPVSVAFQGGLKCVGDPVLRTAVQNSGGSASGASCTGTYSFDFNALMQSGIDPSLIAGAEVFAQYWSRDPQSPSTTSLSNALRFVINP